VQAGLDLRVRPGGVIALLCQLVLEAPLRSCAPIVHLPERFLFRSRKRKKRPEIEKRFRRFGTMSKPTRERIFLLYTSDCCFTQTPAAPYVKGQRVRAPRNRCSSHFPAKNSVIDRVSSIASSIAFHRFRHRNSDHRIYAPIFIGVGVRALMRWRARFARWEDFNSWRKRWRATNAR
jgi:hypothetical protein